MALNTPANQSPLAGDELPKPLWATFFQQIYDALKPYEKINPLVSYTVLTVPHAASYTGGMIFVSNEAGGSIPAFSDGTNWRRVTDRAIIS